MKPIEKLESRLAPFKEILFNHPINQFLQSSSDLELFMQHHVFAVWDFMSLVKKLQVELTCTDQPWVPNGKAEIRYLINEIVLGEESDVDQHGQYTSHFELYLKAMEELSIMPSPTLHAFTKIRSIDELILAIPSYQIPESVKQFLTFTFTSIQTKSIEEIASIFTFGREDLIPGMFQKIVDQIKLDRPDKVQTLVYYLERHIEVDGGHHAHLAHRMMEYLCQDDSNAWERATLAAEEALRFRIILWDGIVNRT